MIADLHIKYRPSDLAEVVGQPAVCRSLQGLLDNKRYPHAVLFAGPSGVGKTTLARIAARKLGVDTMGVIEIDGATSTGIDAMRNVNETLLFKGFSGDGRKFVIVDECHALSTAAWQSLLKIVEEPPSHVYWAFCTTNLDKVPATIKTRTHLYQLASVPSPDLTKLITKVLKAEGVSLDPAVVDIVVREANGSPRQALVAASMVIGCESASDAAALLRSGASNTEVIDLCRMLVSGRGFNWMKTQRLLSSLKETDPESIRLTVVRYVTTSVLAEKKTEPALRLFAILEAFSGYWPPNEGLAPLILALGSLLFEE